MAAMPLYSSLCTAMVSLKVFSKCEVAMADICIFIEYFMTTKTFDLSDFCLFRNRFFNIKLYTRY